MSHVDDWNYDSIYYPRSVVTSSSDSNVAAPEEQQQHAPAIASAWDTSDTYTPCTTRPHFTHASGLRRTRSRSLGSSVEREYGMDYRVLLQKNSRRPYSFAQPRHSLVPSLSPVRVNKDSVETTTVVEKATAPAAPNILMHAMYGLINGTIVLPVLLSFASIIYRDTAFAPYMPVLSKLVLVSGLVHQVCFSTFSSLPFAIGQVQDAGLIFLSSMATQIVTFGQEHNLSDATLLATATVSLSLATALLGLGLVLLGRWRLAQYVQMLPTSVVGGYLAYIGWFCGLAGVGLMAGTSDVTLELVAHQWHLVVPGLAGGVLIYVSARRLKHMAVVPTCILLLLAVFYSTLWYTGTSVEEATHAGWIRQMDPPPPWYRTWSYLRLDKVAWGVLPRLALTEISMIFVVALSSSLDVAAIELELGDPLDYNHELGTVGISNIISGLTGGYTGSYIFSQSIFSLRAGIRSPVAGYVLALFQAFVLILPFPLLSYVPNFFFGSLLSMIAIDLIYEWLYDVRRKLSLHEYMVCLGTFAFIMLTNVEYGILLGVATYVALQKAGCDMSEVETAPGADSALNVATVDKGYGATAI